MGTVPTVIPMKAKITMKANHLFRTMSIVFSLMQFPRLQADTAPLSCQNWGRLQVDRSLVGTPLTVGGRTFKTGFGVSGDAMIPYDLPECKVPGWKSLSGWVGIDEGEKKIEGDGAEFMVTDGSVVLWRSGFMKRHESAKRFEVSLPPKTRRVYLQTYSGRNIWSDHCDWCELQTRVTGGGLFRLPLSSYVLRAPAMWGTNFVRRFRGCTNKAA